jgi:hypothetical protein
MMMAHNILDAVHSANTFEILRNAFFAKGELVGNPANLIFR